MVASFLLPVAGDFFFQCVPFLLACVVSDGGFSFYLSFMSVVADSV